MYDIIIWLFYKNRLAKSNRPVRKVNNMREGIHPEYHECKVVCNCGNEFTTGSTGQQRAAAARGAIDKFNRRYGIKQD